MNINPEQFYTYKSLFSVRRTQSASDNPKEFYKKANCCIHINGSISSVSEDDLDSKLKLTRTSYVSPDQFVNSSWYYYFKKDLEQSSAIVFIGYSLYDIDIEKILFSSPMLKKKTYFIIKKDPSKKEAYLLSKYGHVLAIGVDGFGDKIEDIIVSNNADEEEFWIDAFNKYQLTDPQQGISDDQILNFILHGALEKGYIDNAMSSNQAKPFLIVRRCVEEIDKMLDSRRFLAIISDFGNGKSIILQEVMALFSMLGKQVFYLQNPDGNYAKDIEKINNLRGESILVIDDYTLNIDILVYLAKFNSDKIKVIFSDRSNNHDRLRKSLIEDGLLFFEIGADKLNKDEIKHFVDIIDNLGFWGDKATLHVQRKIELINNDDRGQISHILLNLFNSPQIKKRIDSLLSPIIDDNNYKATIFAICLLEIINLPVKPSLISEVSGTDLIYSSELRNNLCFNQLFQLKEDKVISKSSLFSIRMLQNFFSSSYITDSLLNLAEKFDKLKDSGAVQKELFKSLLRFSFVERLLPEKGKLNSLVKYYEELKISVGWLKFDPHFWLQYGMARMNYGQLEKAQSNLDEAYVLASHKQYYDTSYLDTQQARLYILKSIDENDGNIVWDYFQKAHNLLRVLDDDVYKYRQVATYKRFFESKYNVLSKKNKEYFKIAVTQMKKNLENSTYINPGFVFSDYSMESCYKCLSEILEKI